MDDRLVNIWQIYYDNQTEHACWPRFKKYYNPVCSPFMENKVILDIVESEDIEPSAWFGVLSPKFGNKARGAIGRNPTPTTLNDKLIELEQSNISVLGFLRSTQQENNILQGNRMHRPGKSPSFSEIMDTTLKLAGIDYDIRQKHRKVKRFNDQGRQTGEEIANFMMNYVICPFWIYKMYVSEILKPCMEVMESNEELSKVLWENSEYHHNKNMRPQLKADLGVPYYPLHTFVCERLWSVFMNIHREITFTHF